MTSTILSELIQTALILTAEAHLRVLSIICDGKSVNCSTLRELVCNIFVHNFADLENSFPHPTLNYNVYVLLDPCHMLKLARNALAEYKIFHTADDTVEWKYIIALHNIQQQLTLKFKNKLNSQCINWHQNKMKVKFAANTFSASVANAMKYLKNEGVEDFQDCKSYSKIY